MCKHKIYFTSKITLLVPQIVNTLQKVMIITIIIIIIIIIKQAPKYIYKRSLSIIRCPRRLLNHVSLESFFTDSITNNKDDPYLSVPTRKVSIISFHLKIALQNGIQLFDPDYG
jgi:hypothetical protein